MKGCLALNAFTMGVVAVLWCTPFRDIGVDVLLYMMCAQVLIAVFVCLPVFAFYLVVRRCGLVESAYRALGWFVGAITSLPLAP